MREKLQRFFYGRYGTDDFNKFLFYAELVLLVITFFFRNIVIEILFYFVIILYLYRSLSKNIVARSIENQKFIKIKSKITHRFKAIQKNFQEKDYKHFVCPNCSQIVRVPKGKGNITITCPSCRKQFDKRS